MKKYFKPMTKVFKVEEKETVLAGSGGPARVGARISGPGSDEESGITKMTSDEVEDGLGFAKSFSPSFDDAE